MRAFRPVQFDEIALFAGFISPGTADASPADSMAGKQAEAAIMQPDGVFDGLLQRVEQESQSCTESRREDETGVDLVVVEMSVVLAGWERLADTWTGGKGAATVHSVSPFRDDANRPGRLRQRKLTWLRQSIWMAT